MAAGADSGHQDTLHPAAPLREGDVLVVRRVLAYKPVGVDRARRARANVAIREADGYAGRPGCARRRRLVR
jgi:hypothetical protein